MGQRYHRDRRRDRMLLKIFISHLLLALAKCKKIKLCVHKVHKVCATCIHMYPHVFRLLNVSLAMLPYQIWHPHSLAPACWHLLQPDATFCLRTLLHGRSGHEFRVSLFKPWSLALYSTSSTYLMAAYDSKNMIPLLMTFDEHDFLQLSQ